MRPLSRRHRGNLPADVVRSLPLLPGEQVLASAEDDAGRWYAGTALALLVPEHDGWRRLPWESIERATWDRDSERLVVVETAEFGQPEPTYRAALSSPERLLELTRERITASIVVTMFEPVAGKRGVTVSGRRSPHSDDDLAWSVLVDRGLDEGSAEVRAAAERGLAAARSEIGL
ncbi:MAG TPA: hypothetical protein VNP20_13805 [Nocardioidaceae bacterium]|nr:hypothetical protein [Nocardioidaceae bacterium]